jgi:hypothetical protein
VDIEAVQQKYQDRLMELPNVTGVGIGQKAGKEVLKVFVTRKLPASALRPEELVPKTLDGYATDVEEIGTITTYSS